MIMTAMTKRKNILLVDDEIDIIESLKMILDDFDCKSFCFSSPNHALEKFMEDPTLFDLIISDQKMPIMTGLELAEKIKSVSHDIPVIILTGYSSDIVDSNNYISKIIDKPFDVDQLFVEIDKLIK